MSARRGRVVLVALLGLSATGILATAWADERGAAQTLLAAIDQDTEHKAVAADAVTQSRQALERATRMREANDETRARLAETLGRQWAEVARDQIRAAAAEETANKARVAADDAGAYAERERALLEEAIARQGRLQAELEAIKSKPGPERTAAVGASLDAGAAKGPKATPTGPATPPGRAPRPNAGGTDAGLMP